MYSKIKINPGGGLMKKFTVGMCFSLIFFMGLMVCGCATGPEITEMDGVWKYQKYSGGAYIDKIMIVGKPRTAEARIQYEDHISGVLKKRNIDAISSYTVIADMKDINRENLKRAADAAGVKAVLATRVVGVEEKDVLVSRRENIYSANGTMIIASYLGPPEPFHFTKARLETGLFEVESAKLIWEATSAIINPDSVDEAIEDFTKAIIQQLAKDGYIR
jgi:hypothetical protein